jgi:hypothetical protein
LLLFAAAPLNLWAAPCERNFEVDLLAQARNVNLDFWRGQSPARLMELHSEAAALLLPYPEKMRMEREHGLPELRGKVEEARMNRLAIRNLMELIERLSARKGDLKATAGTSSPQVLKLSVRGRTMIQMRRDLDRLLAALPLKKSRLLIRYYASAREDLMFEHGTDRFGMTFDSTSAWDEFGQAAVLEDMNLTPEDAIFAEPAEIYFELHWNSEYGSDFENEFTHGARAIAIYDAGQFEDLESDFFIFKSPKEKRKALLAIIKAVP